MMFEDVDEEHGPVHPAAAPAVAALAGLAAADLSGLDEANLLALARCVQRLSHRIDAVAVAVAGRLVDRCQAATGKDAATAALLRDVLNISGPAAAGRVRVAAAALPRQMISGEVVPARLPVLAGALAAGTISGEHAGVISAAMNRLPARVDAEGRELCEKVLVEQAVLVDPVTLRRIARHVLAMADPDGTPDTDAHDKMELHIGRRKANGLTHIWGELDDVTIEMLHQAIGPLAKPRHQTGDTPGDPAEDIGDLLDRKGDDTVGDDTAGDVESACAGGDRDDDDDDDEHDDDDEQQPSNADNTAGTHGDRHEDDQQAGDPAGTESDSTGGNAGAAPNPYYVGGPRTTDTAVAPSDTADIDTDIDIDTDTDIGTDGSGNADPPPRRDWSFEDPVELEPPDAVDRYGRPAFSRQRDPVEEALRDHRRAEVRRAHALAELLRHHLNSGAGPAHGGERPHITVTIDHRDLLDRVGAALLDFGGPVTAATARRLACDARILPAVLDGDSQVLDVGRAQYTFPPHVRRAIILRDKGCAWPGCDRPAQWTDCHHIQWWTRDLGPTSVANGCLLCEGHHIEAHKGEWTITMAADGHPDFAPPRRIDPNQTPRRNTLHHTAPRMSLGR